MAMVKRINTIRISQAKRAFNRLFQLEVRHQFFQDQKCADLAFFPLPSTEKTLQNHKLLFRQQDSGFNLFGESNSKSGQGFLNFFATVIDQDFHYRTRFSDSAGPGEVVLFYERPRSKYLGTLVLPIKAESFYHRFPISDEAQLVLYDQAGLPIRTFSGQKKTGGFETWVAMEGLATGKYLLKAEVDNGDTAEHTFFFLPEPLPANFYGIVQILIPESDRASALEKILSFRRQTLQWTFYIRLSKEYQGWNIALSDEEQYTDGKDKYGVYTPIIFRPYHKAEDLEHMSEGTVLTFKTVSDSNRAKRIPRFEIPKQHLRLELINDKTKIKKTFLHLPNPPLDSPDAEITIHV